MESSARAPAATTPVPLLPILGATTLLTAAAARLYLSAGGLHLALFCPFRQITGWPCPTCGATRSLAALAQGDLAAALSFNPLVATVAMFSIAAGAVSVAGRLSRVELPTPRPQPALQPLLRAGAVGLVLANWAYLILQS